MWTLTFCFYLFFFFFSFSSFSSSSSSNPSSTPSPRPPSFPPHPPLLPLSISFPWITSSPMLMSSSLSRSGTISLISRKLMEKMVRVHFFIFINDWSFFFLKEAKCLLEIWLQSCNVEVMGIVLRRPSGTSTTSSLMDPLLSNSFTSASFSTELWLISQLDQQFNELESYQQEVVINLVAN